MLAHEWRELETLSGHIVALRERLAAARRTGNTGLVEGLDAEIDRAIRQRDRLMRHISTRLGSAAAERLRASGQAACRRKRGAGCNTALPPDRE
ncbi:MAG: hypothetical protein AB7O13_20915 [Alphaproteobacteria bacterium]